MIKRIRTIKESIQELKKLDEHTAVTEYFVRELCKKGIVKSIKSGSKVLLDFNNLVEKINDFSFD